MSKVIKNNDGVAIVEGTPAASLVKDLDRFFASKPPERMAGESISQPRTIDQTIKTSKTRGRRPSFENLSVEEQAEITARREQMMEDRRAKSEENTMFLGGSKDFNERTGSSAQDNTMFLGGSKDFNERTGSRLNTKKTDAQDNTMFLGGSKDFNEKGSIDEKNKRKVTSGIRIKSSGKGRSCPDPNMHILMADGSQKKAGELVIGDLVSTNHEIGFDLGDFEVEYVEIVKNIEKIKLIFDESEIICSLTHKFYVDNSWKEAKDMVIGDVVSDKKLTAIEKVEDGDVVHITVKDAHTYICEGLLSHNKRFRSPPKDNADQRPVSGTRVRRNEAKEKAEARRERFFQRRRSKKEARRSEEEREATKGKFITTLGK